MPQYWRAGEYTIKTVIFVEKKLMETKRLFIDVLLSIDFNIQFFVNSNVQL